jgi:hypothetical protein
MAEAPDQIRNEIEETRARMSETVEAIGYRADVKGRAKEAIVDKTRGVVDRVTGAMPDMPDMPSMPDVSGAVPSREQVRHAASVAQSNPMGLMIGAAAAGYLVGLALPKTRMEDERIGELADDLKQQVRGVGREAVEHGKEVVQQTAQAAGEAAREAGREHGSELAETVQQRAQDVASSS